MSLVVSDILLVGGSHVPITHDALELIIHRPMALAPLYREPSGPSSSVQGPLALAPLNRDPHWP